MRTSELITSLVADDIVRPAMRRSQIFLRLAYGAIISVALFFAFLGIRPDFDQAIMDPRVQFKFLFASALFSCLLPLMIISIRPEIHLHKFLYGLMIPALVLAVGVSLQIASCEIGTCLAGMIGHYALACLVNIPLLSVGPFIALLTLMQNGATTEPARSGAIAGAASGSIGALIYAFHCPDDSALFVALWYLSATAIMTFGGAVIGARVLRW